MHPDDGGSCGALGGRKRRHLQTLPGEVEGGHTESERTGPGSELPRGRNEKKHEVQCHAADTAAEFESQQKGSIYKN